MSEEGTCPDLYSMVLEHHPALALVASLEAFLHYVRSLCTNLIKLISSQMTDRESLERGILNLKMNDLFIRG